MSREQEIATLLKEKYSDQLLFEDEDKPLDPLAFRTPEGDSLLHIASIRGDIQSIEQLLSLGIDIDLQGDMGNTALHYARRHGQHQAYQTLLDRGASPDIVNEFGEPASGRE